MSVVLALASSLIGSQARWTNLLQLMIALQSRSIDGSSSGNDGDRGGQDPATDGLWGDHS